MRKDDTKMFFVANVIGSVKIQLIFSDMFGCGYKNGGCHRAAVCLRKDDGTISCKCGSGYRGDGKNCTGPCELNNGGCHRNADCMYKVSSFISLMIPPANFVCGGYTVFTSVRAWVRPCVHL